MWLTPHRQILNAGGGDSGYAFASASLTALQSAFDAFAEAANTAGLSQDFEAAVNDFTALFASFSDRNAADGTAFNHLLDLMKDAVNVVIDLIETLADRIARQLLETQPLTDTVEVTVHKPQAPLPHEFHDVQVTVVRDRADLGSAR